MLQDEARKLFQAALNPESLVRSDGFTRDGFLPEYGYIYFPSILKLALRVLEPLAHRVASLLKRW